MDVIAYRPEHLRTLRLQPAQANMAAFLTDDVIEDTAHLEAYTILHDGAPIAVAGLMDIWPGRALAWSYIAEGAGPHMVGITRIVRNFLDGAEIRRVEAYVDPEFPEGLRWIDLLGFRREGLLRAFTPDGRDQFVYARVRHG